MFIVIGRVKLQWKGWFIFTCILPLHNVLKDCLDIDFFSVVDSYSVAILICPLILLSCLDALLFPKFQCHRRSQSSTKRLVYVYMYLSIEECFERSFGYWFLLNSVTIPNYPLIFLSCLFLPFNKWHFLYFFQIYGYKEWSNVRFLLVCLEVSFLLYYFLLLMPLSTILHQWFDMFYLYNNDWWGLKIRDYSYLFFSLLLKCNLVFVGSCSEILMLSSFILAIGHSATTIHI